MQRIEPETLVIEPETVQRIEPETLTTPEPTRPEPTRPEPVETKLGAELTLIDHVPMPELASEILSRVAIEPAEALADESTPHANESAPLADESTPRADESTPTPPPEDREAEHLKRAQAHLEAKSKAEKKAWAKATVKSRKAPVKASAKAKKAVDLADVKLAAKEWKVAQTKAKKAAKVGKPEKPAKLAKVKATKAAKAKPAKAEKLPPWELAPTSPPKFFQAPEYLPFKTQFLHHHGKFISLFGKKIRVRQMDAFTRKAHGLVNVIGCDKGEQCFEPTLMVFKTAKAAATFFAMCADADDDVFNWIETGDGVEWHADDWGVVNSNVMNGADLDADE